jgi:hypothetical protein
LGAILTVFYSAENEAYRKTKTPAALMPLLVILFIVSYGILTMLVYEQGQTIESQRGLIREMLKDSTQLASLKDKHSREDIARQSSQQSSQQSAQQGSQQGAQLDKPSMQTDGVGAGQASGGVKGSDAKRLDKDGKKSGRAAHSMKQIPGKPEADLQDVRRSTRVI